MSSPARRCSSTWNDLRASSSTPATSSAPPAARQSRAHPLRGRAPHRSRVRQLQQLPGGGGQEPAWQITARSMRIDTDANEGHAEGAKLRFQGVTILAAPALSFPLGSQRSRACCRPICSSTTAAASEYGQPYYWNIAPQRDATFTPFVMTRRAGPTANSATWSPGHLGLHQPRPAAACPRVTGPKRWSHKLRNDGDQGAPTGGTASAPSACPMSPTGSDLTCRVESRTTACCPPTCNCSASRRPPGARSRPMPACSAGRCCKRWTPRRATSAPSSAARRSACARPRHRRSCARQLPPLGPQAGSKADWSWSSTASTFRVARSPQAGSTGSRAHLLAHVAAPMGRRGLVADPARRRQRGAIYRWTSWP